MSELVTFMTSLVSLLFAAILLFWLYRDYRTDAYRQKLFALRDELFDEATKGELPFDNPAYGMLRTTMNGFIRFAHRMNLPQTIVLLLVIDSKHQDFRVPFHKRLEEAANRLPPVQQELIKRYYLRMNFYTIEYLLLSSPFMLLTIIIPIVFALEAKKHVQGLVRRLSGPLDKVDAAALATGEI